MSETIVFKVGHKYENVKGVYEVIDIKDESMTIRWGNGEQVSTPKDLQRRILERIQFEKDRHEQLNNTAGSKTKKRAGSAGKVFTGLDNSDFKNSISQTSWRNRTGLGGIVAKKIISNKFNLNSWAVAGTPAVQWCDIKLRKQKDQKLQANFYAQVDENNLYYGLCIERPDSSNNIKNDWDAFLSWLDNEQNEIWLNTIASENDLYIYDLNKKCFNDTIRSCNGKWKKENEDITSLCDFFKNLHQFNQTVITISKIDKKEDIIAQKEGISDTISSLFNTLMPVYEYIAS
ncbi:Uncharacterized protein dnl_21840 [Desulfonema limicola]|uniref:Uncharacterized protein n=1 Tax=Desulfonema limicola TaxID=45656 RepID=A0A975GG42_9BACT|nr:hypothetical protein [Desulfonema limicola]QTA79902.1 Uncharacterized protein dnl_21840 [Desulfonema limicola]